MIEISGQLAFVLVVLISIAGLLFGGERNRQHEERMKRLELRERELSKYDDERDQEDNR